MRRMRMRRMRRMRMRRMRMRMRRMRRMRMRMRKRSRKGQGHTDATWQHHGGHDALFWARMESGGRKWFPGHTINSTM